MILPRLSPSGPGFIDLYNKYKDTGVEIIGIAFDENGSEVVPGVVKKWVLTTLFILGGAILLRHAVCVRTRLP